MPMRIQRKRSRGWRMPEGAVYVGRPTKYGNRYVIGEPYPFVNDHNCTAEDVVWLFEVELKGMEAMGTLEEFIKPLRGKDLACWCKDGSPCHADVLLKYANREDAVSCELKKSMLVGKSALDIAMEV